jgi:hypothetical protein
MALTHMTRVSMPLCMTPEMHNDACDYTWAVDVYLFALIVCEVLAGQRAFPLTPGVIVLTKQVVMGE